MGNSSSKSKKNANKDFKDLYNVVDYIATYYILTMDFQSLKKLTEKEYCDNLVVLTGDIIKKYFNDLDITYLAQRIKNGAEVNELMKDHVTFLTKDQFDTLDIKNDKNKSIKKKRVCIGIAKFYIKIAHLFAAIVTTINPVYTYKDANGNNIEVPLMEKNTIPKNVPRTLKKLNICENRINSLRKNQTETGVGNNQEVVNPNICSINLNSNQNIKTLADEPGIKELMNLYLDDNYDYATGVFTGMSPPTEAIFLRDLKTFYTAFTGKNDMPPEYKSFSDIKLKDFNTINGCQGPDPAYEKAYTLNKNDKLFVKYAENLKKMIKTATTRQNELLEIINTIFTNVDDSYSDKQKIRVNPKLTEDILQATVVKARQIIIKLYVGCEYDFIEGLKIYEAIVNSKIIQTTESQVKNLNREKKTTVAKAIAPRLQIDKTQQQPVGMPMQQPVGMPIQQPVGMPIQQPVGMPIQQPVGMPMQQPVGMPIQAPVMPMQQQLDVYPDSEVSSNLSETNTSDFGNKIQANYPSNTQNVYAMKNLE